MNPSIGSQLLLGMEEFSFHLDRRIGTNSTVRIWKGEGFSQDSVRALATERSRGDGSIEFETGGYEALHSALPQASQLVIVLVPQGTLDQGQRKGCPRIDRSTKIAALRGRE